MVYLIRYLNTKVLSSVWFKTQFYLERLEDWDRMVFVFGGGFREPNKSRDSGRGHTHSLLRLPPVASRKDGSVHTLMVEKKVQRQAETTRVEAEHADLCIMNRVSQF